MTDLQQGGNAPLPGDALAVTFAWTAAGEVDADV